MVLEIEKKKNTQEENVEKSKGQNIFLWLLVFIIVISVAVGNVYFADQYSTAIRVVAITVGLAIAFAIVAFTSQGKKALVFFTDARTELRRIIWPTRPEGMQTTFIVMGVTVVTSLILWGLDSIIVSLINFLTDLRF